MNDDPLGAARGITALIGITMLTAAFPLALASPLIDGRKLAALTLALTGTWILDHTNTRQNTNHEQEPQ
jgi:hypothetical protein